MQHTQPKVVLITGASRGIGKALAAALAANGAALGLVARNETELQAVKAELIAMGAQTEIFAGSVTNEDFVNSTVQAMIDRFGRLDVLVNNAGFGIFGAAETISSEQWDDVFATNTKGTFLFCKAAVPHMKTKQAGHIINVASDVAKRVFSGGSLYCASKYAQDAFSAAIRKELRPFKIKVSVVYSGLVDSFFHAEKEGDPAHANWLKNQDMANTIKFIIDQPSHVVIDELMIHPLEQDY